eukprot:7292374-Prymnesium_polylepis.1
MAALSLSRRLDGRVERQRGRRPRVVGRGAVPRDRVAPHHYQPPRRRSRRAPQEPAVDYDQAAAV